MDKQKLRHPRPAAYAARIPILHEVARKCGYALAVHGSFNRDLDLIAVPWVSRVRSPAFLIKRLAASIGATVPGYTSSLKRVYKQPQRKPHGRQGWVIIIGNGLYLDVSVFSKKAVFTPQ